MTDKDRTRMTDIDWAILETNRLIGVVPDHAYRSDMIAAALRKAKADGMREAAAMLDGDGKWNCAPSCRFDDEAVRWAKHMRESAEILDPPAS